MIAIYSVEDCHFLCMNVVVCLIENVQRRQSNFFALGTVICCICVQSYYRYGDVGVDVWFEDVEVFIAHCNHCL